jgi:hypothetical protein
MENKKTASKKQTRALAALALSPPPGNGVHPKLAQFGFDNDGKPARDERQLLIDVRLFAMERLLRTVAETSAFILTQTDIRKIAKVDNAVDVLKDVTQLVETANNPH